jgi:hypothetical protein
MHSLVRATRDALEVEGTKHRERPWNRNARYLDLDVTKSELRRALRIANALITAFEARGWQVALGAGDDRKTYVVLFGQRVSFSIRETIKKIANPPAEARRLNDGTIYTPWQNKYRDEASGLLALVIRNSWGHGVDKSWVETATRPLEDRLNDFVIAVIRRAHQEAESERHRREEAQRRREAEELQRAEEERREAEAARVAALEQQALDWETSTRLRRYLDAVRKRAEGDPEAERPDSPLREWLEWAEDYAQTLDPLSLPVVELPLLGLEEVDE